MVVQLATHALILTFSVLLSVLLSSSRPGFGTLTMRIQGQTQLLSLQLLSMTRVLQQRQTQQRVLHDESQDGRTRPRAPHPHLAGMHVFVVSQLEQHTKKHARDHHTLTPSTRHDAN